MKAKDFEQQFDESVDITASLDLSKAKRVLQEQKRVNVDFPTWMIESLDREAEKLGVTRQSIIKVWLAERLEKAALTHPSSGTR
ncbi:MAG TPA: CopG family antitoxin [Nitrosomonas europaea]|uniref:type II toxin-antitoxin system BrnA family antitoxin n=1 Tax=Nitrosomonas europaea TaxID=915 RepID=UPI00249015E9|nr:CopG family antitoxin [Nitrosomonas europaea]HRO57237.1 CopG family antitoxin [Nitrosomonas europaea]HUM74858.1 CopG family antitoxin [Nitrosomonas europaea]